MATMYKTQYAVQVGFGPEFPNYVTISDATDPGAGTTAYQQILAKEDIRVTVTEEDVTGERIIPYHAIYDATVVMTRVEVEKPADETCA